MTAPRHLLMTADAMGGVWTYALELAAALQPFGTEITLAVMGAPLSKAQRAQLSGLPHVQCRHRPFRLEWMDQPWAEVDAAGHWLLALARECGADLIHLNGYAHGALPWEAPVVIVAHSCVCSWWRAVHGRPTPKKYHEYRRRIGEGLRFADGVVAPTAAMLTALNGQVAQGRVIPNSRDATSFRAGKKQRVIFAAGRVWDEAKNIALLNEIAPTLPWPVHVAGETRHPNGDEHPLPNVRLLGKLPEAQLAAQLASAAIFAAPARYEPFGLTILEAALSGCALVLGDIPSLRELWEGAALFLPPEDPQAWRTALTDLIADVALRRSLAAKAQARAKHFSPERMARAYAELYAHLSRTSRRTSHLPATTQRAPLPTAPRLSTFNSQLSTSSAA